VLIVAAPFTLAIVTQNVGGGGGAGKPHGASLAASHRQARRRSGRAPGHSRRPPAHRDHQAAIRHRRDRSPGHATRRDGFLVSTCSYCDPASAACGSVPPPGSRHLRDGGALEDRVCTPGAVDPRVTQSDIQSTICVPGYTGEVRPPYSYTAPLESELIRSYGLSLSAAKTELDHLISLELGGAPGEISLAHAQHEIVDWVKYQPPTSGGSAPTASSSSAAPAVPSAVSSCEPNYSGVCLDPNAGDYDCAGGGGDGPEYVEGPIRVVGADRFHLDYDGDGIACE
jgi:hypothetical protein